MNVWSNSELYCLWCGEVCNSCTLSGADTGRWVRGGRRRRGRSWKWQSSFRVRHSQRLCGISPMCETRGRVCGDMHIFLCSGVSTDLCSARYTMEPATPWATRIMSCAAIYSLIVYCHMHIPLMSNTTLLTCHFPNYYCHMHIPLMSNTTLLTCHYCHMHIPLMSYTTLLTCHFPNYYCHVSIYQYLSGYLCSCI